MALVRFVQQPGPAISFPIHSNAITATPRRAATCQQRFVGQLPAFFSNSEVLGGCFREAHTRGDFPRGQLAPAEAIDRVYISVADAAHIADEQMRDRCAEERLSERLG